MKKIIFIILSLFIFNISSANIYSPDYVDKCCLLNLIDYKNNLPSITYNLSTKYPQDKKYLDLIVFRVVQIINRKYASRKSYIYKLLSEKIADYMYNHRIQKWTKAYYKLSYLAYTFYRYHIYFKSKDKFDSFLEKIANN